ncbi:MAG: hypothetical protein JXB29_07800 [Sedimentisphaerales bacterium]|nr:hypothetical protein [Sedimentisphaerales bacterium]
MKKKTYMLFITALLQMGFVCNYQLACAKTPSTEPNNPIKKQSPDKSHKPIIDSNKPSDSNQSALPKGTDSTRLSNEKLQAKIYKEAMECFRREMDNYKWIIEYSLVALGVIVGIAGVVVTMVLYMLRNRINKTEEKVNIDDLWTKAGTAYSLGHYEDAAEIWRQINSKFKANTRQFFNNWGSSLLNWAGTTENKNKRVRLASEAIEQYLKAEEFTKGIAAYNIACCYAILDNEDECEKWLNTAKETERLLSWKRASEDKDLKKYAVRQWFKNLWGLE